jgi:hypothetical protein
MTKTPKKPAEADDKKFTEVVQHFLNTPPKPHKPKGEKPGKKSQA